MSLFKLKFIKFKIYKYINNFLNAKKVYRKLILIFLDYFFIYSSWLITLAILKDFNQIIKISSVLFHFWSIQILAFPIYFFTNQYKPLTRFINTSSFYNIIARNIFLILLPILYLDIARLKNVEITFWLIFLFLVLLFQIGYRFIIRDLINESLKLSRINTRKRAAIYKADYFGFQLSNLIQIEGEYTVVCFLDDSPTLIGNSINSIPIKNISKFNNNKDNIDALIISASSGPLYKFKSLIKKFEKIGINVLYLSPLKSIQEINDSNNNTKINQKEILGRPRVKPSEILLKASINNNISVCITGAGGSIGSELCRQTILMKPKYLIMIDFCEYNLFKINQELRQLNINETTIIPKLINAEDELNLEKTFINYKVNLIFHAAAYKHVGVVEINPLEGLRNNLLTTRSICRAAIKNNVKKMILISSDKAVRPTNVMGGSKFLSELIVKDFSKNNQSSTKFAAVRFGNVIDSSGSVIPIFREQIQNGGPITITHPEMERFFMTISEAVELVLQSSVLTNGGETFILNMGKPIKIIDIAKKMIYLSGLKIKDSKNKNGDIEIKIIGAKKGEKLKEELFINGNIIETLHPLINKAEENIFFESQLVNKINRIIELSKEQKEDEALELYNEIIDTYK